MAKDHSRKEKGMKQNSTNRCGDSRKKNIGTRRQTKTRIIGLEVQLD